MGNENTNVKDEIEVMDVLSAFWRRKWIIVGIVGCTMLFAELFLSIQPKGVRTELSVNVLWDGVEKGEYPDGSIFSGRDIIAPNILIQLGSQVNLSNHISIEDIVPQNIDREKSDNPDSVHYPTQFKVILNENRENLIGSGIEKEILLKKIVKIFIQTLKNKYQNEILFLAKFPDDFIEKNECDEIIYIMGNYIQSLELILNQKNKDVRSTGANSNGDDFSEILNRLLTLKKFGYKKLVKKIETFSCMKNKSILISRLSERLSELENSRNKNRKIVEATLNLLKIVKLKAFSRTGKSKIAAEQPRRQSGVDSPAPALLAGGNYLYYLIKMNLDAEINAINDSWNMDKLKWRIEKIKKNEREFLTNRQTVLDQFTMIENKFLAILEDANNQNRRHLLSRLGDGIQIADKSVQILQPQYQPKLILAIAFIGSLFFSGTLALMADSVIRSKKDC